MESRRRDRVPQRLERHAVVARSELELLERDAHGATLTHGQGWSTTFRHPSPSRTNRRRSWSRSSRCSQNSQLEGTSRYPPHRAGRGGSSGCAATAASSSTRDAIGSDWCDAAALRREAIGRVAQYASDSAGGTRSTLPSTRTCRPPPWKSSAACGFASSSLPLRDS